MKCTKCEKETKVLVNGKCLYCATIDNLLPITEEEFSEIASNETYKRQNNEKTTD
jgi:hypothetical protein